MKKIESFRNLSDITTDGNSLASGALCLVISVKIQGRGSTRRGRGRGVGESEEVNHEYVSRWKLYLPFVLRDQWTRPEWVSSEKIGWQISRNWVCGHQWPYFKQSMGNAWKICDNFDGSKDETSVAACVWIMGGRSGLGSEGSPAGRWTVIMNLTCILRRLLWPTVSIFCIILHIFLRAVVRTFEEDTSFHAAVACDFLQNKPIVRQNS